MSLISGSMSASHEAMLEGFVQIDSKACLGRVLGWLSIPYQLAINASWHYSILRRRSVVSSIDGPILVLGAGIG
jgi:hypothetical protein